MHKVHVWAELSDEMFHAYEGEARRQGVELASLVQQTVNCLIRELEEEERAGMGDVGTS
ncbi:MAG: hypothetical protein OER21_02165 [Gemmatimonadota bacterium]|nr:hypothetical protein [Gemmatimonadota bacterium]